MSLLSHLRKRLLETPALAGRPRRLYVCRRLTNADELIEWAKSQGFRTMLPAADLHVTVCFSRTPFLPTIVSERRPMVVSGGPRLVKPLGDKGAVVLAFSSPVLRARHEQFRIDGASWDYPQYQPHVTLTYDGAPEDLRGVKPYEGALHFGPELWADVKDDWKETIEEAAVKRLGRLVIKAYNPNQPRDPAGTPTGGRWTSSRATPRAQDYTSSASMVARYDAYRDEMHRMRNAGDIAGLRRYEFGRGRDISRAYDDYRLALISDLERQGTPPRTPAPAPALIPAGVTPSYTALPKPTEKPWETAAWVNDPERQRLLDAVKGPYPGYDESRRRKAALKAWVEQNVPVYEHIYATPLMLQDPEDLARNLSALSPSQREQLVSRLAHIDPLSQGNDWVQLNDVRPLMSLLTPAEHAGIRDTVMSQIRHLTPTEAEELAKQHRSRPRIGLVALANADPAPSPTVPAGSRGVPATGAQIEAHLNRYEPVLGARLTNAIHGNGMWSSDFNVFADDFALTWSMMGSGTTAQKLAHASLTVNGLGGPGSLWEGYRNDGQPLLTDRVEGHFRALHQHTQEFHQQNPIRGSRYDANTGMLTVTRGIGDHVTAYSPAAAESWTIDGNTAQRFGRLMSRNDRSWTLLSAQIPMQNVLFTYQSIRALSDYWPDEADLKGKKEIAVMGGALRNLTVEHRG